jgi:hypothetical protein
VIFCAHMCLHMCRAAITSICIALLLLPQQYLCLVTRGDFLAVST